MGEETKHHWSVPAVAGFLSGIASRMVVAPLDVLKIRFQLQRTAVKAPSDGEAPRYTGIRQALRTIAQSEGGLLALWKGNFAGLLLYASYGAVQFSTFKKLKELTESKHMMAHQSFCIGFLGGTIATATTYPLDLLRTKLAANDQSRPGLGSLQFVTTAKAILRHEGLAGFYRGLTPSLLLVGPTIGISFMVYEHLMSTARRLTCTGTDEPHIALAVLSGWTAGVISKTTVLPLDLIKRRHQVTQLQPMGQHTTRQSMSLLQTARHIIRHEGGVRALYRGATPAVLKTATASAIAFASYELILRLSTPD